MQRLSGHVIMLALATVMQAVPIVAHADPLVVDFSFSNTDPFGVPGSVSGQLDFASAGTDIAASAVYITGLPQGKTSPFSSATNLLTASELVFGNEFDVSDTGLVSAATLGIRMTAGGNYFKLAYGLNNEFDYLNGGFSYNEDGFGGITFTTVGTDVPEPGTFLILLSAATILLLVQRRLLHKASRGTSG